MRRDLEESGLSFDEPHLTHFGGMLLTRRFRKQVDLRRRLRGTVRVPQRAGDHTPSDLTVAQIFAIIAGLRRLNKTEVLQYNGTFLSLLELTSFPDQTTLRRFLKRLTPDAVRQIVRVHDQLRRELSPTPQSPSGPVFDIDPVVLTLCRTMSRTEAFTLSARRRAEM